LHEFVWSKHFNQRLRRLAVNTGFQASKESRNENPGFPYLDATGKGTGQIMAAAKIRFDKKKGRYQIESFGNQYIRATNVRPQ